MGISEVFSFFSGFSFAFLFFPVAILAWKTSKIAFPVDGLPPLFSRIIFVFLCGYIAAMIIFCSGDLTNRLFSNEENLNKEFLSFGGLMGIIAYVFSLGKRKQ